MTLQDKDIDITRNIKIIEWLKSELLTDVSSIYKAMATQTKDQINEPIAESLTNIILVGYLLGKRLGIDYNVIDSGIENKIKLGLIEDHEVERHYGDLSELSRHFNNARMRR